MGKGRRGPEFFYTGMCANEQKVLYVRIELYYTRYSFRGEIFFLFRLARSFLLMRESGLFS